MATPPQTDVVQQQKETSWTLARWPGASTGGTAGERESKSRTEEMAQQAFVKGQIQILTPAAVLRALVLELEPPRRSQSP